MNGQRRGNGDPGIKEKKGNNKGKRYLAQYRAKMEQEGRELAESLSKVNQRFTGIYREVTAIEREV